MSTCDCQVVEPTRKFMEPSSIDQFRHRMKHLDSMIVRCDRDKEELKEELAFVKMKYQEFLLKSGEKSSVCDREEPWSDDRNDIYKA